MPPRKALHPGNWPAADYAAFARAYQKGDLFDDTAGPGAHLAAATREHINHAWRRWLGFLDKREPVALAELPADRITKDRVRAYVEQLQTEVRPTTTATTIAALAHGAQIIAPERDWSWLRSVVRGLEAYAMPQDRFHHLVPGWQTLDLGIALMDEADQHARKTHKRCEIQYRDGLLIALLSIWPIRRRSLAALTVTRHLERVEDGVILLLYPEDTKARRMESFWVPEALLPYLRRYLDVIRPRLIRGLDDGGLWISYQGNTLAEDSIYLIVRKRLFAAFGKDMGVHDFRRAAATFLAIDAPELVGLIPGILQHTSPDVGEAHYNLARSTTASRRHGAMITDLRRKLNNPHRLERRP